MQKIKKKLLAVQGVTAVILPSKALGFVRDMITAGYFGTRMQSDAYASAYSLFYIPILLLASCITSTLVPMCMKARAETGRGGADRFLSAAAGFFALVAAALTVVLYVSAPHVVKAVYPRFEPHKLALTARLLRIMLVTLTFHVLAVVLSSVLNAYERYVPAQLMGFPLSAGVIVSTVFFSGKYGVEATAWGVAAASAAEFAVLIPFVRRDFRYTLRSPFAGGTAASLVRAGLPALLSMAVSELNHMIDRFLASGTGEGSIAAMSYAYKLITFLLGVLLVPLTTVAFTHLSRMAAQRDEEGVMGLVRNCTVLVLQVSVPIVAIGCVMSRDVIKMAYMRGSFDMRSVEITSGALLFYLLGVPAFGLRDMLNRVFHAERDTFTPFRAAVLTVLVNIALNLILVRSMGINGLALATSAAGYAGMTALLVVLGRRRGRLADRRMLFALLPVLPAALCAALTAWAVSRAMFPAPGAWPAFVRLVAATAAGGAVYVVIMAAFRLLGRRVGDHDR